MERNISIRLMQDKDLNIAESIINAAFHSTAGRVDELSLYREIQPDGWFMIDLDGCPAGTIGATFYDRYAHIGLMAIHPDKQNCGLATFAMNHILQMTENRGINTVVLDASAKGQPLYAKLGFTGFDETLVYPFPSGSGNVPLPDGVQRITPGDIDAISRMDVPVFGANRERVFYCLLEKFPQRGFMVKDSGGNIAGYCFVQANRIGPLVAIESHSADLLLQAALELSYDEPASIAVPAENINAVNLLEQRGLTRVRTNLHMVKGAPLSPGDRQRVFAQASLAIG